MALYNKVRPQVFSDVLGQEKTVRILKDGLKKKQDDYPQVNIFVGPHGTGKTTCARILAKVLNCEHPTEDGEPCCTCESCVSIQNQTSPSVYELDAASNNGVDDARAIIEQTKFIPIGKKKVFILDEVQMLSNQAWNAFLKVFEEPPKDVFFILCTTEALKVTATAKSRCQEVVFTSIAEDVIRERLRSLCESEGISITEDGLEMLSRNAEGHMRDAISSLEKYSVYDTITAEVILDDTGESPVKVVGDILSNVFAGNTREALEILGAEHKRGKSTKRIVSSMMAMLTDLISVLHGLDLINGSSEYQEVVKHLATVTTKAAAVHVLDALIDAYPIFNVPQTAFYLEAVLTNLISTESLLCDMEKEIRELKERPVVFAEVTTKQEENPTVKQADVIPFNEMKPAATESDEEKPFFDLDDSEIESLSNEFGKICGGETIDNMDEVESVVSMEEMESVSEKDIVSEVVDEVESFGEEILEETKALPIGTPIHNLAKPSEVLEETAETEDEMDIPDMETDLDETEVDLPDVSEVEALFSSPMDAVVDPTALPENVRVLSYEDAQEQLREDVEEELCEDDSCEDEEESTSVNGNIISYEDIMNQLNSVDDSKQPDKEDETVSEKEEVKSLDFDEEDDFDFFMTGGYARC